MDDMTGGKRKSVTVKALKRALKKVGLKTTGKKATLTRRAKKARLMGGQASEALKGVRTTVKGVGETAKGVVGAPFAATEAVLGKGGRRH
jgi:hypothetical protein